MKAEEKESVPKQPNSSSIPVGGTLGILAHGYKGIMLWRQVRQEQYEAFVNENHKKNSNEEN